MFTHWCDEAYLPLEALYLVCLKKIQTSDIALMFMDQILFYVHHPIHLYLHHTLVWTPVYIACIFLSMQDRNYTEYINFTFDSKMLWQQMKSILHKLQAACYNQWHACNITLWSCLTTSVSICKLIWQHIAGNRGLKIFALRCDFLS